MTTQTDEQGINAKPARRFQNPREILTRSGVGMIITLVLQYILGMINNLFVKFPDTTERALLWRFAFTRFTEVTHIVVGFLMLIGAVVFLLRSIRAKHRTWVVVSAIGLAGIISAIASGVLFVTTQADPYSLVMSYGFLIALVGYGWGLYAARR